jgi:hypothetical protein
MDLQIADMTHSDAINKIIHDNANEIGYLHPGIIREFIESQNFLIAIDNSIIVGFVYFYYRKDDILTIRKIISTQIGVGSILIDYFKERYNTIQLKCPVDSAINNWFKNKGFILIGVLPGKRRELNLYAFNQNNDYSI